MKVIRVVESDSYWREYWEDLMPNDVLPTWRRMCDSRWEPWTHYDQDSASVAVRLASPEAWVVARKLGLCLPFSRRGLYVQVWTGLDRHDNIRMSMSVNGVGVGWEDDDMGIVNALLDVEEKAC